MTSKWDPGEPPIRVTPDDSGASGPLAEVRIRGFRSISDASFRPGPLSALVGEAGAGKSNLLSAIRAVLDPGAAPLAVRDVAEEDGHGIRITARLVDGSVLSVDRRPGGISGGGSEGRFPILYLPARLRADRVLASFPDEFDASQEAARVLRTAVPAPGDRDERGTHPPGSTEAARGLVEGIESLHQAGVTGTVLLIEEPELFLPPQLQRYLYRLLRMLSANGNQILYSTHSPSFLNVARLDELVLTERSAEGGTRLFQPEPLPADEEFRAHSEFDAARGELFLARAAVLVEGLTEKLALPFVFQAMGYDCDRERISIIECGGKANVLLVAKVSKTVGIPFVAVHDRDAPAGKKPNQAERKLNRVIRDTVGEDALVELTPDFEGVAGIAGRRHKPARAWRSFADLDEADVPPPFRRIVERAVTLAGG